VRWIPSTEFQKVVARLACDPHAADRYPIEPAARLRDPAAHAAWMRAHAAELARVTPT
jgi:hypothetical protein